MPASPPPTRQLRIATACRGTLLAVALVAMVGPLLWACAPMSSGTDLAGPPGDAVHTATAPAVAPSADPTRGTPSRPSTAGPSGKPRATPLRIKPTTRPAPPPDPPGNPSYEDTVLTLVNQERAKAGCRAVTRDSRLAKAARAHSADMAARNYFDHTTPEGVTFDKRIIQAGYRYSRAAENIALGQSSPASVMKGWMNSKGHRDNILNCALTNLGVGLAHSTGGRPYWTQDFGTPA